MYDPRDDSAHETGAGRSDAGSDAGAGSGFEGVRFADDVPADAVGTAEIAALRAIRAGLIEQAAVVAAAEARSMRLLAQASRIAQDRTARIPGTRSRAREMELRSIAAELAVAVHVNDRTMQARLSDAEQLLRLFPATVDAMEAGRVTRAHATAVLDVGRVLADPAVRAAFEEVVLDHAAANTPARTRAFARRLAERVHPRSIADRFAESNRERRVTVTELDDGMARLEALLPVVEAFGIYDRLTRGAKAIQDADTVARREHAAATATTDSTATTTANAAGTPRFDERTRDQVRADLLTDLLLTGSPVIDPTLDRSPGGIGAIRGHVQITVPVTTLTGVTGNGAELDGRAPVDPDTARRLAGDAPGWDRVMTDPVKGTVLEVDRYHPSASQQRFLDARDPHCRFPGCRQPAKRCQLDHNHEHQHGGATRLGNLSNLCVRHHTMKTETAWTVRQLDGGSLEWTSPLGFTSPDEPVPRVVFVPEPDPDPDGPPPPF